MKTFMIELREFLLGQLAQMASHMKTPAIKTILIMTMLGFVIGFMTGAVIW